MEDSRAKEPSTARCSSTHGRVCYTGLQYSRSVFCLMEPTSLALLLCILDVYTAFTYGTQCDEGEYLTADGACCHVCKMGMMVSEDCNGSSGTICKPCSNGTFMNGSNGGHNCLQCKTCDRGLFILQDCTTIQDTICEVSDGYYCLHYKDKECSHAVEHSKCAPGQHIKSPGTKASDTVCEACPPGFYYLEGVNCTKWPDCSDNNEVEAQEGTSTTDVNCKPKRKRYGLIGVPAVGILLLITIVCICHTDKQTKSPVEETSPNDQTDASQSRTL